MVRIKAHIQTRIDGNYTLYSAENKAGYKVGDFLFVASKIKLNKGFVTAIIEPKQQLKLTQIF